MLNPTSQRRPSRCVQDHAYNTYNTYLTREEAKLKTLPVPDIAREYYERQDPCEPPRRARSAEYTLLHCC